MPQLDFVSFHYILNTLSLSYLFVYVCATLFLLKPIFLEFFLRDKSSTVVFSESMLLFFMYSNKVVFSTLPRLTPNLQELKSQVKKRWEWYKYIPRLNRRVYVHRKALSFG